MNFMGNVEQSLHKGNNPLMTFSGRREGLSKRHPSYNEESAFRKDGPRKKGETVFLITKKTRMGRKGGIPTVGKL